MKYLLIARLFLYAGTAADFATTRYAAGHGAHEAGIQGDNVRAQIYGPVPLRDGDGHDRHED